MTNEEKRKNYRDEERKKSISTLDFIISIIQRQIKELNDKDADSYLNYYMNFFTNARNELNDENNYHVPVVVFISAYNLVSNYFDAHSRTLGYDAKAHQHYYHASVGQLKDELWRLAGNA